MLKAKKDNITITLWNEQQVAIFAGLGWDISRPSEVIIEKSIKHHRKPSKVGPVEPEISADATL